MYYNSYVPKWTKQQFVKWANSKYPGFNSRHNKMKKRQLVAIFINSK